MFFESMPPRSPKSLPFEHAENSDIFFPRFLQNLEMSAPPASSTPAATTAPAASPMPSAQVLLHAAKLAIEQDKPMQLDYFVDTATGKAFMGEDQETKEKMLVKSNDEFTSLIQKVYKVSEDFIIITENSIYIVSGKIQKRKIQAPALRGY